jgi:hypothetical protein
MICRSDTFNLLENKFLTDPYNGVAHYYIENIGTVSFNTVALGLVRQLLLHCTTRIPWLLQSLYEKLRPNRIPELQRTLGLLESFALGRDGLIYENIWLVVDGMDGLRDASDTNKMAKIFNRLSGSGFKGC